jgi:TadE-like protein
MVEFIVIAAVLLLLIMATIQFALIYQAKITLNYATFETARAGALNNARMWAMELAFARAMAPLYTTPYVKQTGGDCRSDFQLGALAGPEVGLELSNVKCARQHVREVLAAGHARILLVNPSANSFDGHNAVTAHGRTYIPNDNLMYRSAFPDALSAQSIQDANLIKVHIGYCFELLVPLVDRLISRMVANAPTALEPENFGPAAAGSFAAACTASHNPPRYGVPIYAQAVMRMQSEPVRDAFCSGQCATASGWPRDRISP